MSFGIYDDRDKSLVLANAGFTRPLLVRGGQVEEIDIEGVPLGIFEGQRYVEQRLSLQPGDVVVLISDGVGESTNRRCEEFGYRRLQSLLVEWAERPAQEIADDILESTRRHDDGTRASDDRTAVVLRVL